MNNTLLSTILTRTPGPWSCHICKALVEEPRHADDGQYFNAPDNEDQIYCASCGGCQANNLPADSYCDSCYDALTRQVEALRDPVLIEATRKVLGFA